jgi:O-antigen ligase
MFALGTVMVVAGLLVVSSSARLEVFDASTIEVSRAALLVPPRRCVRPARSGRLLRAVVIALIPMAVVVAAAAGSRGPLIAMAIIGAVGLARAIARPAWLSWRLAGAVSALALASILALVVAGGALPALSTSRYGLFEDFIARAAGGDLPAGSGDTSSARRVALFEVAGQMFQERPLFGYGTGSFAAMSPRYLPPPHEAWPHNAVLQFGAEFGVIGVAVFATVVVVALRRRVGTDATGAPSRSCSPSSS